VAAANAAAGVAERVKAAAVEEAAVAAGKARWADLAKTRRQQRISLQ